MNKFFKLLFIGLLALPTASRSQLVYTFTAINAAIPDGNATGLVNVQQITDAPGINITDLNITLNISGTGIGGFNGDLYVTLQHDSGYSVLLNRVGARTGAGYGYGESGLGVTFDDAASANVHIYRLALKGNHTTLLGGSLSGTWQPDARTDDPASVLDSSPQPATLASFNGVPLNGAWTLFVSDVSSGATHQLDSWSISAVPEPERYAVLAGVGLLGFALLRKRRTSARRSA